MTHPTSPRRPAAATQAGGATVEAVLVTPLLLVLFLLVIAGGRVASGQQQVNGAARDAARAASIERDPASAVEAAQTVATGALTTDAGGPETCAAVDVSVDTDAFQPGGSVTVAVACTIPLGDLTLLKLPGSRTMHARFTHPVDLYRGVDTGAAP